MILSVTKMSSDHYVLSKQTDRDGTVMQQAPGDNSDSDSGSGVGSEDDAMDASGGLSEQQVPKGPIVDDDGFELVQRRRR